MDSVLKAPKWDQSWIGSKRRQNLFVFKELLQFLPLSKITSIPVMILKLESPEFPGGRSMWHAWSTIKKKRPTFSK